MRRITVWPGTHTIKGVLYRRAQYRDQHGRMRSRSLGRADAMSEADAITACEKLERDFNRGLLDPDTPPTLGKWVAHLRATRHVSAGYADRMDYTIDKYLLPHFGETKRMDRVTVPHAQAWLAWLREQIVKEKTDDTPATYLRPHSVLSQVQIARAIWNSAGQAYTLANPFKALRVRVVRKPKPVPTLSTADLLRVIDAAPDPAWKALIALCGLAGLRRGEALAMTWDRVDFAANRLRVPCRKTEESTGEADRYCRMVPELARILKATPKASDRLAPVTTRNLTRAMKGIIERSGVPEWKDPFQGLRRWRPSTWKDEHPAAVVDSWLGHGPEIARQHYYEVPEHHYGESELDALRRRVRELERSAGEANQ